MLQAGQMHFPLIRLCPLETGSHWQLIQGNNEADDDETDNTNINCEE